MRLPCISCYACAHQVMCNRTTAVVRLQKVSLPATYPIFPNNLSYISQRLMKYFSGTSPVYSNVFTYIVALPQAFLAVYHR